MMFFITAFRNFRRNLSYTFLNVFGLGLGIGACLLIFLVVRNELSYDNYHSKADRIYRVTMNGLDFNPSVSFAVVPAMRAEFPELEQVSQSFYQRSGMIKVGDKKYNEKNFFYADQAFLNTFDFQWLAGNPGSALAGPNNMVLTESMARKYFGTQNPMGQVIRLDNQYDLTVTGLIKDQPANTHLPFLYLVSFETLKNDIDPVKRNFYSIEGGTAYIVLPEKYNIEQLRSSLPAFVKRRWGADIAKETRLLLQPLKEIHYDTRYSDRSTVSKNTYWALAAIGLFIILIAAINFINLSTAQASKRAKEVGVRKVLGAVRFQLIRQFLGETALLVVSALALGVVAAALFLSEAATWLDIRISSHALAGPVVISFMAGLALLLTLLAGLYPAFVQSAYKPAAAFKGIRIPIVRGFSLRKSLVVVQFVISQMLIIGTLVVAYQMDFFRNQDLGFDKEAVVSFPLPDNAKRHVVEQQLAAIPGVETISFSSGAPGYSNNFAPFSAPDRGMFKADVTELKFIDENYTKLFDIKVLAGEGIVRLEREDTLHRVVVNEALIHKLGIQDPEKAIGVRFKEIQKTVTIKGVIQDFQSESKHKERRPLIIGYHPFRFYNVSVKLKPGTIVQTMGSIDKMWSSLFPEGLFEYEFLDDRIASFYQQEQKLYIAFRLFAGIAILIGCLGLYGLITYAAIQRTKEVGIRKVLGASMLRIVYLFCQEFIWLIVIAFCIAAPVAYYLMDSWLQNFAYHINIGTSVFIVAIAISFVIAGLTIAWQTVKAAVANPVKALRSE
jgi:putative ABC transport system permease protein